jgi:hypothetical protein
LWIITRDSDYGSMYGGKGFFNQLLYEELLKVSPGAEAFLFDNIPEGIKHFADIMGVPADKVPTPSQIEEIKEEEETLPPPRRLDWIYAGQRAAFYDAHPLPPQSFYDARSFFDVLGRPLPTTSFTADVKAAAPVFDPLGRPLPNPATES